MVFAFAFSPDGSRIASGADDSTIRLWDAGSGDALAVLRGHDSLVHAVAFSPDGSRIASASYDKTIRLWGAKSGEPLAVLRGHDSGVSAVAFSPDGSRIASGSGDRTIRLWDAKCGEPLAFLRGHDSSVRAFAFSPDGSRIASGSLATVRLWLADRESLLKLSTGLETERTTQHMLDPLFDELVLSADVVAHLRSQEGLPGDLRERAIRLATIQGDDPSELDTTARAIVRRSDGTPEEYRRALRLAGAASGLRPENGALLSTLGVALYRTCDLPKALETLTRSDGIQQDHPANAAFLAMAHSRLGHEDRARAELARARELLSQDRWKQDEESQVFLLEAEDLIEGRSPPAEDRR